MCNITIFNPFILQGTYRNPICPWWGTVESLMTKIQL